MIKNELLNEKIKLPLEIKKRNNLKSKNKGLLDININSNLQEKLNELKSNLDSLNNPNNNSTNNTKEIIKENNDYINQKFFFDFDNLIKQNETKDFFNKKIADIKKRKNVEIFIFLFDDLNTNLNKEKTKEIKINKNKKNKNIIKYIKSNINIKTNTTKFSLNKNKENKNKNKDTNKYKNFTNKIKPIILNINSFQANKGISNEKIKPLNKNNTDFLKEFLIENNLMKKGKSIVLLISLNENFIGIFHHKNNSLFNFDFKDEKLIAKNFLRNLLFGRIEYGLDELIEDIDFRILNKYVLNFVHLIFLTFCFFLITVYLLFSYKDIIFSYKRSFKNNKNIEDNIETIRYITNKSLNKEKRCLFNNDKTCLICLEEIAILKNNNDTNNNNFKVNCCKQDVCNSGEIYKVDNKDTHNDILDQNLDLFSNGIYDYNNLNKAYSQTYNLTSSSSSAPVPTSEIYNYNKDNCNFNKNIFSIEYLADKNLLLINDTEIDNFISKEKFEKIEKKENAENIIFSPFFIEDNNNNLMKKLFTNPPANFYQEKKEDYNKNNDNNNDNDNKINSKNCFEEKMHNNSLNSEYQINQEISICIQDSKSKNIIYNKIK
jgi:hypothetical protein